MNAGTLQEARKVATVWTADMIERAARLWDKGHTVPQLAETFGVSPQAMKSLIRRQRESFVHRPVNRVPKAERAAPQRERRKPGAPFIPDIAKAGSTRTDGQPVSLMDLTLLSCRWPVSGAKAATLFCGGHAATGSYCPAHLRLSTRPRGGALS